ncbi:MAG: hypothetical protein NZ888_01205 [Candidatus Nitrosocaldus sp.]|nr:hypothetical protein [Candidatus Nitrosocaldus sp.]MDW8000959.1 hypothetical protein [Candidatus Nitrosocaldus sp.]
MIIAMAYMQRKNGTGYDVHMALSYRWGVDTCWCSSASSGTGTCQQDDDDYAGQGYDGHDRGALVLSRWLSGQQGMGAPTKWVG